MADNKLTKSAGEHWVCSAMSRLGWGVALTRDGLERTDILAVDPNATPRRMIEVQVKTCTGDGNAANWPLGEKAQQPALSGDEWFVMVALGKNPATPPRSFIIPRDHVAAAAWIRHMDWLTDPTVPAGTRNSHISTARVQLPFFTGYEDRWDLLSQPTAHAPVLLPSNFHTLAQDPRVGLPPGHPWHTNLPIW